MAENLHPSRGGFHFDVNDTSSVSKTPSFSEFSIKTRPHHVEPAPEPAPPRSAWESETVDKSSQMPSGTYVIQFPKEQIFSYPPPENSIKFETLSRRKPRRSRCCSCLCYTLVFLFILVIIAAVSSVIFYLVVKPVSPEYTVSSVSIHGFKLTSLSSFSPEFDVSIQAVNPNKNLRIYYLSGSQVTVSYDGVSLANGILPEFFQPAKNVTVFRTALKGSNVFLADGIISAMMKEQDQKNVPLRLDVKAPVKIKVGAVKTWTIYVKVKCDVSVDSMGENSKIVSKKCDYKVKLL